MGNAQRDTKFLTRKQKEKKDQALKKLKEEEATSDDFDIVQNTEDFYDVDLRQELYIPKETLEINVGYILKYFENNDKKVKQELDFEYPELIKFVQTKVKSYYLLVNGKQVSNRHYKINMSQCQTSNPVFEFVYEKYPFFESIAKQASYTISYLRHSFLMRIAAYIGIAPIVRAITSIQKQDQVGILAALCSKRLLFMLGTTILGPNMLFGSFSLIIKTFFPFAYPLIYLARLGTSSFV